MIKPCLVEVRQLFLLERVDVQHRCLTCWFVIVAAVASSDVKITSLVNCDRILLHISVKMCERGDLWLIGAQVEKPVDLNLPLLALPCELDEIAADLEDLRIVHIDRVRQINHGYLPLFRF